MFIKISKVRTDQEIDVSSKQFSEIDENPQSPIPIPNWKIKL